MQRSDLVANPFALMMHPHDVVEAMTQSPDLKDLKSRVCRPLDRPLIPRVGVTISEFEEDLDLSEVNSFDDEQINDEDKH